MIHRVAGLLLTGLLAAAPATVFAQGGPTVNPPINAKERAALFPTQAQIDQGRALAESSCAACHGIDGIAPDASRPNLAGQRTTYLYREMMSYQQGQRSDLAMREAVAFLDADALLKTAIYYASLPPPYNRERAADAAEIDAKMDDDPLVAVKSATAGCASCHGADGNASIPGMPNLTAQHQDYFVQAMLEYQRGERTHNMMQTLSASLSEDTINNMGLYYALQEPRPSPAAATGDAAAGKRLAEACATCHGSDGNTTAPDTPSLAGQDPTYFVQSLKSYLNGQREHGGMRGALEGLDEQDFRDMAAFYVSQPPLPRVVRKPLTAREWLARCDRCHGANGNSTDPRYSRLAGQNEPYLVEVLQAYANGERSNSIMHAMSAPLTRGIIERLAAYYTIQEPRSVVYFELPCDEQQ
jgi:cytochrome c553